MEWMSHRKRRETKQQPSILPDPAVPGCCFVAFRFPCDIHTIHSVVCDLYLINPNVMLWLNMFQSSIYFSPPSKGNVTCSVLCKIGRQVCVTGDSRINDRVNVIWDGSERSYIHPVFPSHVRPCGAPAIFSSAAAHHLITFTMLRTRTAHTYSLRLVLC